MDKYTVEEIKKRSAKTRKNIKGKRDRDDVEVFNAGQIRIYCDQVDFLCKKIEQLQKT